MWSMEWLRVTQTGKQKVCIPKSACKPAELVKQAKRHNLCHVMGLWFSSLLDQRANKYQEPLTKKNMVVGKIKNRIV